MMKPKASKPTICYKVMDIAEVTNALNLCEYLSNFYSLQIDAFDWNEEENLIICLRVKLTYKLIIRIFFNPKLKTELTNKILLTARAVPVLANADKVKFHLIFEL